jgi:hypothetical protein
MNTYAITLYASQPTLSFLDNMAEALRHTILSFSVSRHILLTGIASEEDIEDAVKKAIRICALAGIDSSRHFKQIFIFDESVGCLRPEWLLSMEGLNLLIMQSPSLNEKMAQWLWKLVDVSK